MIAPILSVFLLATAIFTLFLIGRALSIPVRREQWDDDTENVSVVIPVRNEAAHLPELIASLERQVYTAEMEIIFVDDGSEDDSVSVIRNAQCTSPLTIRLLFSDRENKRKLTNKQLALDHGIREARFDLVACTDGDMRAAENWLSALAGMMRSGHDLVYGHTVMESGKNLFTILQSFQLESLFSVALLFHYMGITGSCMGNNLMIRRSSFLERGGFDSIGYTITEDRALLRHFRNSAGSTAPVVPFYPTAWTTPHRSIALFFQQVQRWAVGGFSNGRNLMVSFVLFYIFSAASLVCVFGAAGTLNRSLSALNGILFWVLLSIVFVRNKSCVSPLLFPVYCLFLIMELLVLPFGLVLRKEVIWKGKRV